MAHMIGTLVSFMSWIMVGMAAVSVIVGIMKTRNLRGTLTSLVLGGVMVAVSLLIPHLTPDEKESGGKFRKRGGGGVTIWVARPQQPPVGRLHPLLLLLRRPLLCLLHLKVPHHRPLLVGPRVGVRRGIGRG